MKFILSLFFILVFSFSSLGQVIIGGVDDKKEQFAPFHQRLNCSSQIINSDCGRYLDVIKLVLNYQNLFCSSSLNRESAISGMDRNHDIPSLLGEDDKNLAKSIFEKIIVYFQHDPSGNPVNICSLPESLIISFTIDLMN